MARATFKSGWHTGGITGFEWQMKAVLWKKGPVIGCGNEQAGGSRQTEGQRTNIIRDRA